MSSEGASLLKIDFLLPKSLFNVGTPAGHGMATPASDVLKHPCGMRTCAVAEIFDRPVMRAFSPSYAVKHWSTLAQVCTKCTVARVHRASIYSKGDAHYRRSWYYVFSHDTIRYGMSSLSIAVKTGAGTGTRSASRKSARCGRPPTIRLRRYRSWGRRLSTPSRSARARTSSFRADLK